jgi:hypothetical protein
MFIDKFIDLWNRFIKIIIFYMIFFLVFYDLYVPGSDLFSLPASFNTLLGFVFITRF